MSHFNAAYAHNEARRDVFWVTDVDLEIEISVDFRRSDPIMSVKAHMGGTGAPGLDHLQSRTIW